MDEFEDRRPLWNFTSKVADLGTIAQVLLLLSPPLILGIGVLVGLADKYPTARVVGIIVLLPLGIVSGVTVVHPAMSQYLTRRQTDLEELSFRVAARFQDGSRVPSDWTQERELRALLEGVEHLNLFYGYAAHSANVSITILRGGRLVRQWNDTDGRWYASVQFPQALHKGETHVVAIRFQLPEDASECPPYCTITPAHLVRNVSIRILFGDPVPTSIRSTYWVSDVSPVQCLEKVLRPNDAGIVEYRRRRTKPGHRYGLTWTWE